MLEAVSEKTGKRITGFYSKDDLEQEILKVSVEGDSWDVIEDGYMSYCFTPFDDGYDYYESYTLPVSDDPSRWLMPDEITHRKYMPEATITYLTTSEPWVDEAEETGYIRAVRADHYDGIPDGEPLILVWAFARDDDTGELDIDFTAQPDTVLEADAT